MSKHDTQASPANYWSQHTVSTRAFSSREEALKHFYWRSDQYMDYLRHMPVKGQDGKVVVDYGCGPGNDVMGILAHSEPARLIAMDVSPKAIEIAQANQKFFDGQAEFHLLDENNNVIPLETNSVDYIHCSGVLHHCKDLSTIMQEFRRVLKDGGEAAIMVYNYDSLWLHLYTAWMQPVLNKKFVGLPLMEAFRANTDGEECPISTCYRPQEFSQLVRQFGFECEFKGAAISMLEMQIMRYRLQAIKDYNLAKEHRDFLLNLTFDNRMVPYFNGHVAGIDACYRLTKS